MLYSWNTEKEKKENSKNIPDLFLYPTNLHHIFAPKNSLKRTKVRRNSNPTCMITFMHPSCDQFEHSRVKHAWEIKAVVTLHLHRGHIHALYRFGIQSNDIGEADGIFN